MRGKLTFDDARPIAAGLNAAASGHMMREDHVREADAGKLTFDDARPIAAGLNAAASGHMMREDHVREADAGKLTFDDARPIAAGLNAAASGHMMREDHVREADAGKLTFDDARPIAMGRNAPASGHMTREDRKCEADAGKLTFDDARPIVVGRNAPASGHMTREDRKCEADASKLTFDDARPIAVGRNALVFGEVVGSSDNMTRVLKQIARVAISDSTVLLLGETGTGKELLARAIHRQSNRSGRPFIRVNCAAIPQSLIASELFGHEKGAFTGAMQRRLGRFEAADGGTLFLDEIGDLPAETQVALLRVLQEREIERVGSNYPIPVNVRIVAATNRNLADGVAAGTFRQDLFYRLAVFPIEIPALRQRPGDIPALVEHFVEQYAKRAAKKITHIGKNTLQLFKTYSWPGNIRELQNVVERAVVNCEGDTLHVEESWLNRASGLRAVPSGPLVKLAEREKEMIEAALAKCGGRISGPEGAAALLGVPRQTLESKIASLGVDKFQFKQRNAKLAC
ncbi:MAG: sigma-54 dependent transcriptional regulator, partial [Ignavibacteriota bacterium]